jgi:hypothetical protein
MAERNASTASDAKHRQHSVAEEPVTSVLKGGDIPVNDSGREWDADEEVLAALGYKVSAEAGAIHALCVSC